MDKDNELVSNDDYSNWCVLFEYLASIDSSLIEISLLVNDFLRSSDGSDE